MNISELDMSDDGKKSRMMDYALDMIHKDVQDDEEKSNINGIVFDVVRKLGLDSLGVNVRELAQQYLDALKGGKFAMEDKENNEPEILDPEAAENSDPNKLFNLGLSETEALEKAILECQPMIEAVKQSHPVVVLDRLADRKDNKPFPIKFYDGSVMNVTPAQAKAFIEVYYKMDDVARRAADKYLKTKNGFRDYLKLNKIEEKLHHTFPVFEEMDEQTLEIIGKLGKHLRGDDLKDAIGTVMRSRGYDPKTGKKLQE